MDLDLKALSQISYPSAVMAIEPHPSMFAYSDTMFEIIKKQILKFESSLDADHEVAIQLANFGQSVTMVVTEIGFEKSAILIFKGLVGDRYSTLVQHVSQLNLLLTSVCKDPDRPKKMIGFVYPAEQ